MLCYINNWLAYSPGTEPVVTVILGPLRRLGDSWTSSQGLEPQHCEPNADGGSGFKRRPLAHVTKPRLVGQLGDVKGDTKEHHDKQTLKMKLLYLFCVVASIPHPSIPILWLRSCLHLTLLLILPRLTYLWRRHLTFHQAESILTRCFILLYFEK